MIFNKTNFSELQFTPDKSSQSPSTWFLGRKLVWRKQFSKPVILLERGKERVEKILEFLTWLIIFAGYGAFAFWIFIHREDLILEPLRLIFFWSKPDPLIFIFILTLYLKMSTTILVFISI